MSQRTVVVYMRGIVVSWWYARQLSFPFSYSLNRSAVFFQSFSSRVNFWFGRNPGRPNSYALPKQKEAIEPQRSKGHDADYMAPTGRRE